MPSNEARELFDAYVDDELPPEQRIAFEEAVEADFVLRRELDEYRNAVSLVRSMPVQGPPDGFLWLVQQRIRRRTRGRYFGYHETPSLVFEAATCAVLIFVMAALYLYTAMSPRPGEDAGERATQAERVAIHPADRRFLEELGRIEVVGTSPMGNELEVQVVVPSDGEEAFRRAMAAHPRFSLVTTSVYRDRSGVWLRVRTMGHPVGERWEQ